MADEPEGLALALGHAIIDNPEVPQEALARAARAMEAMRVGKEHWRFAIGRMGREMHKWHTDNLAAQEGTPDVR
jgi:hypothetical protein